jgi:predicted alpha/beta hydrolase
MIQQESMRVQCSDGVELRGMLLLPAEPKAIVQFNGGTGAKKEFYLPFLTFLAEHGYACCLWDYRGSGESAPQNMKNCTYNFLDYGTKDMPAVKKYLETRFPTLPYLIVGHSVGGQQVGFMDNLEHIKGMLAFAVSTGYLAYMPLSYRILSTYFFYMFSPISIALKGYVASKRFGIMEDLPKKVVEQWRAWCAKPDYFFNERFYGTSVPVGKFKHYNFPVHVFWTSDDPISNKDSIRAYWSQIENQDITSIQKIEPADYGQKKIGHFGFFKKSMRDTLWHEASRKLDLFLV